VIGHPDAEPLVATDEPEFFARFSPNGREIAYHSFIGVRRQPFVVPVTGGTPVQAIVDERDHRAADWLNDSTLILLTNQMDSGYFVSVTRGRDGAWHEPKPFASLTGPSTTARDGRVALFDRVGNLVVMPAGGGTPRMVLPVPDAGYFGWPAWSDDGRRLFVLKDNGVSMTGIWSVSSSGGTPQLVMRFDDPLKPWHRFGFRARGDQLFFTLGEIESDVWTAEVRIR